MAVDGSLGYANLIPHEIWRYRGWLIRVTGFKEEPCSMRVSMQAYGFPEVEAPVPMMVYACSGGASGYCPTYYVVDISTPFGERHLSLDTLTRWQAQGVFWDRVDDLRRDLLRRVTELINEQDPLPESEPRPQPRRMIVALEEA